MSIDDDRENPGDEIDSLKQNSSQEVDENSELATFESVDKIDEQIGVTICNIKNKVAYIEEALNEGSCIVLQFQPLAPRE